MTTAHQQGPGTYRRALLASLAVFVLLLPLWLAATHWYEALQITGQRAEIRNQVSAHGIALTSAVNRRLARLQGLAAFVRIEIDDPAFDAKLEPYVTALLADSTAVLYMSIAPGGAGQLSFPGVGEAGAAESGPAPGTAGQAASTSRLIELADPQGSPSGELGVVARRNVYVDEQLWGQVSMAIDLSPLLAESGIDAPNDQLQLALRDGRGNVFFGDPEVIDSSPVVALIALPDGAWSLFGVPLDGWAASVAGPVRVMQGIAFLVIALLVLLTFTVSNRQAHLARQVMERTAELTEAQQVLEDRVAERTHQLARLLAVTAEIASELALPPLLQLILEHLRQTVTCVAASVVELVGDELVQVAYRGPWPQEEEVGRRFTTGSLGAVWTTVAGRRPCIIQDIRDDSANAQAMRRIIASRPPRPGAQPLSWLGVPLQLQERLIGMLALQNEQVGYFTEERVQLVMSFANQAAIAIENAHLYEQARQLAALQERQKLARELHDSVSQALYGIALGARTARRLLDRDPEQLAEPLDYVLSLAEAGLAEMRSLIFELRPESLEREGLVAALGKQAAAFRARHQLNVVTVLNSDPPLPLMTSEALYRISQEALNNVAKHAQASRVVMSLSESDGLVTLAIEDDGLGFDPEQEFPGHLGLRSMRERCQQAGGSLTIESRPGQGSRVKAQVPLPGA